MKMLQRTCFFTLGCVLVAGRVVAQNYLAMHNGNANPTQEGWSNYTDFGSPQYSAVTNDLGKNSWSILLSSAGGGYSRTLPNISSLDWALSCNLRLVTPNQPVFSTFSLALGTGAKGFSLFFGSDAAGNAQVRVGGGGSSPYTLLGQGTAYNSFQLIYSGETGQASLWANSSQLASGINGIELNMPASISWGGAVQSATSRQANWNSVSLEVIPEPNSLSLLCLGGGVLFCLRRRPLPPPPTANTPAPSCAPMPASTACAAWAPAQ